jgi:cytochrome c oxidase subunit 7c
MIARAATRTTSMVARRGFHTTRPRMSSPYHYPEGPYTNLPFNPRSKYFGAGYWSFMAVGFFAPFGIAGESRAAPPWGAVFGCTMPLTRILVYQTYKSQ